MLVPKWGIFSHTHPLTRLGGCLRRGSRKDVRLGAGGVLWKMLPSGPDLLLPSEAHRSCVYLQEPEQNQAFRSSRKDGGKSSQGLPFK